MDSTLNYCCTSPNPDGEGNIASEPLFVDYAGGDLRLQFNSPCVNAGMNRAWMIDATDIEGNPRIRRDQVDMGAYESDYLPPQISVAPSSQDFGSIQVGTTANRTFTVQNTASGTLSGFASVPAPYSIISGGSYTLAEGESQIVTVRYNPTSAGTHYETVTFTGGGGTTVLVMGSATNPSSGTVQFKSSIVFGVGKRRKRADLGEPKRRFVWGCQCQL